MRASFRTRKESRIQSRAHLTAFPLTGGETEPRPRQSLQVRGDPVGQQQGRPLRDSVRPQRVPDIYNGSLHRARAASACQTGLTACRTGVLQGRQPTLQRSSDSLKALQLASSRTPDTCLLSGGLLLHPSQSSPWSSSLAANLST